jgi:hypothetical protein
VYPVNGQGGADLHTPLAAGRRLDPEAQIDGGGATPDLLFDLGITEGNTPGDVMLDTNVSTCTRTHHLFHHPDSCTK